jgi:hypothetical protein
MSAYKTLILVAAATLVSMSTLQGCVSDELPQCKNANVKCDNEYDAAYRNIIKTFDSNHINVTQSNEILICDSWVECFKIAGCCDDKAFHKKWERIKGPPRDPLDVRPKGGRVSDEDRHVLPTDDCLNGGKKKKC